MRRPPALALVLPLALAASVTALAVLPLCGRADTISQLGAVLELAGGADTDPATDVAPPSHGNGQPRSNSAATTGVFHLSPRLLGHLAANAHRLDLDYSFTLRPPGKGDTLTQHSGLLRYQPPPLGRGHLGFEATLSAERSRAGGLGVSALGLELGARFTLGRWALSLGAGAATRQDLLGPSGAFDGNQTSISAALEARPQRSLLLTGSYTMSGLDSDFAILDETRHRVGAGLHLLRGRLELTLDYGFSAARLPEGAATGGVRNDRVHDGGVALEWALLANLDLFVRAQGFVQRGDDDSSADRVLVLAGVSAHLEGSWLAHTQPRAAVVLSGRNARFQLHAAGAHSVSVVGDFNDWDASASVMQAGSRPGEFTLELELPPGRHAWSFQIDGQLRAPQGVELSPDGFGGKNAILVVDE